MSFCYPNYHYAAILIQMKDIKSGIALQYVQNYVGDILFCEYCNAMPRFGPSCTKNLFGNIHTFLNGYHISFPTLH